MTDAEVPLLKVHLSNNDGHDEVMLYGSPRKRTALKWWSSCCEVNLNCRQRQIWSEHLMTKQLLCSRLLLQSADTHTRRKRHHLSACHRCIAEAAVR